MTPVEVQQLFLDRLGLRIGPEMANYVLRRMTTPSEDTDRSRNPVAVMAGHAMTGVPLRQVIDLDGLTKWFRGEMSS